MSKPIIDSNRNKYWRNSKYELHNLNGPAYVGFYGTKEWWVNGVQVTEENYTEAVSAYLAKESTRSAESVGSLDSLVKLLNDLDSKRVEILEAIAKEAANLLNQSNQGRQS